MSPGHISAAVTLIKPVLNHTHRNQVSFVHINMQPLVMFILNSSQNIMITNNGYVHTVHGASSLYKQTEWLQPGTDD